MQQNTEIASTVNAGYEKRDVNFRAAYIFGATLAAVLIVVIFAMRGLFGYFSEAQTLGPPATPFKNVRELPPSPRLQPDPKSDLARTLEDQQQLLNSYGWADQGTGKVRIPIDRAMDMLLQRGLPVRGQAAAPSEAAAQPKKKASQ
ncbi:MAG TPA: hypothetical protein VFO34_00615 [Candidatus Acidoferrales bacterium]|nr:hypothetical protein [Candidatus Acidoferrales bacterium]